ncbi:MAG: T9SS type A sorting domain-containing protein, partial [Okeania sp. SIO3B3]|nr:T9SS type A sorting domain-containing protein [Okeania sp. SIO3B3]
PNVENLSPLNVENLCPLLDKPIESPLRVSVDGTQREEAITINNNTDFIADVDNIGIKSGKTTDKNDYYKFTLTGKENELSVLVDGLTDNASVELLDTNGKSVLFKSTEKGKKIETIDAELDKGTYYLRVFPQENAQTKYSLSITGKEIHSKPSTATNLGLLGKKKKMVNEEIGFKEAVFRDNSDVYKFALTESYFEIALDDLIQNANITVLDEHGEIIHEKISEDNGLFSEDNVDYYESQKPRTNEEVNIISSTSSTSLEPEESYTVRWTDNFRDNVNLTLYKGSYFQWIEKIGEEISEDNGLFREDNVDYYENQKARIKEFLPTYQTVESSQLTSKQKSLIQEYLKLANLPELSESNAERMREILEITKSDDLLSSLREKIDSISEVLDLYRYRRENFDYYENQKPRIKEFLPVKQNFEYYQLSSSGYFQPGDLAKLFQEVLNTVDLIFRNGVDTKAFMSSFQQVKADNKGIPMRIRGMENKGDGVVVIKIDVSPETNKEKIHREFMQFYDENLRVLGERYQKELAQSDDLLSFWI